MFSPAREFGRKVINDLGLVVKAVATLFRATLKLFAGIVIVPTVAIAGTAALVTGRSRYRFHVFYVVEFLLFARPNQPYYRCRDRLDAQRRECDECCLATEDMKMIEYKKLMNKTLVDQSGSGTSARSDIYRLQKANPIIEMNKSFAAFTRHSFKLNGEMPVLPDHLLPFYAKVEAAHQAMQRYRDLMPLRGENTGCRAIVE